MLIPPRVSQSINTFEGSDYRPAIERSERDFFQARHNHLTSNRPAGTKLATRGSIEPYIFEGSTKTIILFYVFGGTRQI